MSGSINGRETPWHSESPSNLSPSSHGHCPCQYDILAGWLKLTGWIPCLHLFPSNPHCRAIFIKPRLNTRFPSQYLWWLSNASRGLKLLICSWAASTCLSSPTTPSLWISHAPVWLSSSLACKALTWERKIFPHGPSYSNCPSLEEFSTKTEKITAKCLPLELRQTASCQREGPGKAGELAGENEKDSRWVSLPEPGN